MENLKKKELIEALITTKTIKEASNKLNCSEMTIYRALKKPGFKEELEARRKELFRESQKKIADLLSDFAVDSVKEIHKLSTTSEKEIIRLQASKELIDIYLIFEQRKILSKSDISYTLDEMGEF